MNGFVVVSSSDIFLQDQHLFRASDYDATCQTVVINPVCNGTCTFMEKLCFPMLYILYSHLISMLCFCFEYIFHYICKIIFCLERLSYDFFYLWITPLNVRYFLQHNFGVLQHYVGVLQYYFGVQCNRTGTSLYNTCDYETSSEFCQNANHNEQDVERAYTFQTHQELFLPRNLSRVSLSLSIQSSLKYLFMCLRLSTVFQGVS